MLRLISWHQISEIALKNVDINEMIGANPCPNNRYLKEQPSRALMIYATSWPLCTRQWTMFVIAVKPGRSGALQYLRSILLTRINLDTSLGK